MDETLNELGEHIAAGLSGAVASWSVEFGDLTLITDAAHIREVLRFLREDGSCQFICLLDIAGDCLGLRQ